MNLGSVPEGGEADPPTGIGEYELRLPADPEGDAPNRRRPAASISEVVHTTRWALSGMPSCPAATGLFDGPGNLCEWLDGQEGLRAFLFFSDLADAALSRTAELGLRPLDPNDMRMAFAVEGAEAADSMCVLDVSWSREHQEELGSGAVTDVEGTARAMMAYYSGWERDEEDDWADPQVPVGEESRLVVGFDLAPPPDIQRCAQ